MLEANIKRESINRSICLCCNFPTGFVLLFETFSKDFTYIGLEVQVSCQPVFTRPLFSQSMFLTCQSSEFTVSLVRREAIPILGYQWLLFAQSETNFQIKKKIALKWFYIWHCIGITLYSYHDALLWFCTAIILHWCDFALVWVYFYDPTVEGSIEQLNSLETIRLRGFMGAGAWVCECVEALTTRRLEKYVAMYGHLGKQQTPTRDLHRIGICCLLKIKVPDVTYLQSLLTCTNSPWTSRLKLLHDYLTSQYWL